VRLLIIDNYDSFTFNLFQMAGQVFQTTPVVVPNDEPWERIAGRHFDAVIVSPGPGRPERPQDFGISKLALLEMRVPILGVCLGHQGLWHICGGTIGHAPAPMHGRLSPIYHEQTGLFEGVPNPFQAVRYHSLACTGPTPDALRKSAWTADGIVMAIENRSRPMWGVQFHPESICTEFGLQILRNFAQLLAVEAPPTQAPSVAVAPPCTQAPAAHLFSRRMHTELEPVEIFERLFRPCPFAFWLDSSLPDSQTARFSFMGGYADAGVKSVRYFAEQRTIECRDGETVERTSADLLEYLKARLHEVHYHGPPLPFDFASGFVGYFGYELKSLLGGRCSHFSADPDAYLFDVDRFIAFDHAAGDVWLVFRSEAADNSSANAWFDSVERELRAASPAPDGPPARTTTTPVASLTRSPYIDRIRACLSAIRDGESYEVCLTNRWTFRSSVDPFDYYRSLRRRNPAPYSAFLKFEDLAIACSSPERFLKVSPDRTVQSKPIKGTAPRGRDAAEDEALRTRLQTDEKAIAENLMIVDLVRNDLGMVCEIGSVHVPRLMQVESYATVHQLVSTIAGVLRADRTAIDCLRAAFPGGSMTGAPKRRTMEIIDSLEADARGVYSGSIGFLSANGAADLNIAIRTAVFKGDLVTIGSGGAIVALSDPDEEWNEAVLKAEVLLDAFDDEIALARSGDL
jgi:para-aminobenzoate synthetase